MSKDDKLVSGTQLAHALGVSRAQVGVWHARRARNGFPEPVRRSDGLRDVAGARKGTPVWSLSAVRAWRASYVPSTGGRKPGSGLGRPRDPRTGRIAAVTKS